LGAGFLFGLLARRQAKSSDYAYCDGEFQSIIHGKSSWCFWKTAYYNGLPVLLQVPEVGLQFGFD
jgi:hypothetical protein